MAGIHHRCRGGATARVKSVLRLVSIWLALLAADGVALADASTPQGRPQPMSVELHALLGPFRSPEDYFGCQRFDCFSGWIVTVRANKPSAAGRPYGGQYVSVQAPAGWFVDAKAIDTHLCAQDVDLPARKSAAHLWTVQFYECDVDPPDGTFLGKLAGVVLCDLSSTKPYCSDFVPLGGWDAHFADVGYAKRAPTKRIGDDIVVVGQRFRLGRRLPAP
ncbi:MAG: hypothetical protein JWN44_1463 [Myxococcales bacterium]|nr:hypothetical protein [Myxococcales bacterium]